MSTIKTGILKFIYSEKATKFCEIFPLLLTTVHTVKSKGNISQNFVAFSEYMNCNCTVHRLDSKTLATLSLVYLIQAFFEQSDFCQIMIEL